MQCKHNAAPPCSPLSPCALTPNLHRSSIANPPPSFPPPPPPPSPSQCPSQLRGSQERSGSHRPDAQGDALRHLSAKARRNRVNCCGMKPLHSLCALFSAVQGHLLAALLCRAGVPETAPDGPLHLLGLALPPSTSHAFSHPVPIIIILHLVPPSSHPLPPPPTLFPLRSPSRIHLSRGCLPARMLMSHLRMAWPRLLSDSMT